MSEDQTSASKGYLYELNVVKYLQKHGFVKKGFMPAGSENKPDLTIQNKNGEAGCELKISTKVGGGSVNFIHHNGKWKFETSSKSAEQQYLIKIAKKAGFMKLVEANWTATPLKRTPATPDLKALTGSMTKDQIYRVDLANFTSFSFEIDPTVLEKYYIEKGAHYINVGTRGLYLLGGSDPLGMNKSLIARRMKQIPRFSKAARMTMQVQVKNKGAGKAHQFMIEGRFSIATGLSSPYNIGATDGSLPGVVVAKTNLSCFL